MSLDWLTGSGNWASLDDGRASDNLASGLGSSANDASLNRLLLSESSYWDTLHDSRSPDNVTTAYGLTSNNGSFFLEDLSVCHLHNNAVRHGGAALKDLSISHLHNQSILESGHLSALGDVSGSGRLSLNNSQWLAVALSDNLGRKSNLGHLLIASNLLRNLRDITRLRIDNRGVKHQVRNQRVLTASLGAGDNFRSRAIDSDNAGTSSRNIRDA